MKKIIIIGAGASGIYTAVELKRKLKGCTVQVFEAQSKPLKKLLATGNGRCNLSHRPMTIEHFESSNQNLVKDIIEHFDLQKEFNQLGLYTKYIGELLYPMSEQALSVKNILMSHLKDVELHLEEPVESIHYNYNMYKIQTPISTYEADYVVIASGSFASGLSTNLSRKQLVSDLDLKFKDFSPSLTQMNTKKLSKELKGVRVKGTFTLMIHDTVLHQEKGELLFTDYGVSGIAVMQLSRYYQDGCVLHMNFLDEFSDEDILTMVTTHHKSKHPYDGYLNTKLASFLENQNAKTINEQINLLTDYAIPVISLRGNEYAQVCKGGFVLNDFNNDLESKKYPGLYATGEVLDVVGDCGGYNLHFAFASGARVASAIERKEHVKNK